MTEEQPRLKMQWETVSAAGKRCWLPPQPTFGAEGLPPDKPVTPQCPADLLVQQCLPCKGSCQIFILQHVLSRARIWDPLCRFSLYGWAAAFRSCSLCGRATHSNITQARAPWAWGQMSPGGPDGAK